MSEFWPAVGRARCERGEERERVVEVRADDGWTLWVLWCFGALSLGADLNPASTFTAILSREA